MLLYLHHTYFSFIIIVFFFGKMMMGDHGLSDKWYAFEESIKVPLIVVDPRIPQYRRGTRNDVYTLSIDLAPTLLSAASIAVPDTMQGRDIGSLYVGSDKDIANAQLKWRKDFFYEWTLGGLDAENHSANAFDIPAVFALVERDYKYIYWPQFQYEQLFNLAQDPLEEYDIFNYTAALSDDTNSSVINASTGRRGSIRSRNRRRRLNDDKGVAQPLRQTTNSMIKAIRERYSYLKYLSQHGYKV
jgi:hypothetical protein